MHRRDGDVFDAGPTIVTVPHLFEELWALAGRRLSDDVELKRLEPFHRIRFDDGTHFDHSGEVDRMRVELRRVSPSDAAGHERFTAEADHCFKLGFQALGDKAFHPLADLITASPAILRMRGWRSLHGMVASHLKHPKLRMAISLQSLLLGGNPFSVTCIYSLINALERQWGVRWAMVGTGALVNGLVSVLEGLGVRQKVQARLEATALPGLGQHITTSIGASTHPGAGVPGVLMSARALESVLPDVAAFRS